MKANIKQHTVLGEQDSVLIVDDEDAVRKSLQRKLTNRGYRCYEATDAEQALSRLSNNEVAIVILDIDMPNISGIDLFSTMKAFHPHMAIVVATPVSGTNMGIECKKLGAYEYITKPYILEEAALFVGRTLKNRESKIMRNEYQQHLEDRIEEPSVTGSGGRHGETLLHYQLVGNIPEIGTGIPDLAI